MKTFTKCAEKKANKFFNLLQNYTKSIRITAILILLLMGVSNAWAWWFVPGSWNGWDSKEANSGGVAQMNGSNTITFYNVPAGSYNMKLIKGSTWGNGNYANKSGSYITSVTKGNGGDDQIKLSKACDLTFTITNEGTWNCDVSASDPSYYIKYNWNGSGWAWSGSLTSSNSYSCTGQYGGSGSFDHTRVSSTDVDGTNAAATLVNSPSKGDLCVFTYNTSNKSLTITRCNKVTANSKIYFDNSLTNWSNSNIYFVVGHDKPTAYSKVYKMNAVNNTKLFYAEISDTWEDATYYAFVGVDNEWNNGEWGSSNLTSATKYTKAYTAKYDLGTNGCYYITPSTGNNNTAFTITYKESYNNIPKLTATQSAKIRNSITDQQYTIVTGTWPATLKLEGTHLTGFGKDQSARVTISSTTSGSNVNYEAVVTGLITHSYSNLSDDYQFDGWIKGSGTSLTSTNSTYSYNITAVTTVYACFTKKHAITFGVHSSGGGSISATADGNSITSGTKVVGGSEIIFTASPSAGYRIQGWYSDANCTNSLNNGTNTPYTINSLTTNATVYVKYEEIPEEKFAVTIQPNNANYGTVSPSGLQQVGKSGIDITATAETGYQFDEWTCTGGASVEDASNPNTIASATAEGTVTANFSITNYTITYNLNGGTNNTSNPASYTVETETITLQDPTKEEFLFAGWYTTSTFSGTAVTSITKGSTGNKTLYAKWVPYSQCIFFKNTLGWKNVYVYTFTDNAWYNDGTGVHPGTNKLEQGQMTKIGQTDVYYYILTNLTGFSHIAFSDFDMRTYGFFNDNKAIYRSDRDDRLQLFIPKTDQKPTTVQYSKNQYYSSGIWMKYNSTESGYDWRGSTDQNDANQWSKSHSFSTDNPGGYSFKASVTFDNVQTHYFKIHNNKGDWFGNGGTMTQKNCTDWIFGTDNGSNAQITPTITGTYIFTIYLGDGEVSVSLDYPLSVGDYRLAYYDATNGGHDNGCYIKKRTDVEEQRDTASFFIHTDKSPNIYLQECQSITDGVPTWETKATYTSLGDAVTKTGVYNFVLKQTNNGNTHVRALETSETHPYTGDFYIRTDAADGGWNSFRQKSNQITYSSFADGQPNSNFNHYYCKYIDAGRNVKFTIANDYSYCISDTLDNDAIIQPNQSSPGCLPIEANVRFGWDSNTNEISRAYIKGAGQTSDRFLVLQGQDNNLKDANGADIPVGTGDRTGLLANEEILVDQQNWIYQVDVTANNATLVKLIAEYNGTTQYFKGDAENYTGLLSSTASKSYTIRLVYDFKSNHLVTAWLAGGNTVEGEQTLGADMMVIRKDQNTADQLNFDPTNSKMNEVTTGYAVMTFTKAHIQNLQEDNVNPLPDAEKKSERERSLYWVSFPFDVKVSDVFGFGEYAEHWILQYYDGAERAEKGLFSDSGTYWKYIFDTDTELKAGQGYVLVLDLDKIEFLHGAKEVSLYFPSINPLTTISGVLPTEHEVPAHECTIDREWTDPENGTTYHHRWTDSHWNLIGVPGFADIQDFNVTAYHFTQYTPDVSFYYAFDLKNSTYTVASAATKFQAMYSYMVQFAGTINWVSKTVTGVAPQPTELAARRNSNSDGPERVALRLELAQGEEVADRTFVQLQQEGATANFDLSLDLTKIMNSGFSNIYTLTDSLKIQVAGNALPMEETVVPVGVNIATAGEYTFLMPDGTEGMVVELIDYEANTTTNLLLDDYTVNLPTGSNETRFALSIKPEKTATNVGNIGGTMNDGQGVRKFIIDGKLYLQKDGMLYDAQGHIVR